MLLASFRGREDASMKARTSGWIVALVLACAAPAVAADPPASAPADPGPEARRHMAQVHKKMAACLESTRPMAECRTEMLGNCRSLMGESGCPMMGPGMMHGGMGHGPHMMEPKPKEPPKP
jgi:hypothetical protein